jgi:hypothetical protein
VKVTAGSRVESVVDDYYQFMTYPAFKISLGLSQKTEPLSVAFQGGYYLLVLDTRFTDGVS